MVDLVRMQPVRWQVPKATSRASRRHSSPPMPALRRIELPGAGPEDVIFGADGLVYTGIADGRILRVDLATGGIETVTNTGGRPLGLCADENGSLLICDAYRGLLRWTGAEIEVLVDAVEGEPLNMASNVVRDPRDGAVYFSASSRRWPLEQWMGDLLEHSGTGRLLRYGPDGTVDTLLDGLQYANGVAFTPDLDSLVVAETAAYRLTRYRLRGPNAGTCEVLVDNLPGFPDNIALGGDGLIWVTLAAPRDPVLDLLLPRHGALRQLAWLLPEHLRPRPKRTAWVLAIGPDGTVVHDLQRDGDEHAMVTGVAEADGTLVLGSLDESAIAVTHLPTA